MAENGRGPQRVVLFTIECAQVGSALQQFVERHSDSIALVCISALNRSPADVAREVKTHYRARGMRWVGYLAASYLAYFPIVHGAGLVRRLTGRAPRRLTLKQLCKRNGIPIVAIDDVNSPAAVQTIRQSGARLGVSFWFDQIFDRPSIDAFDALIGVHPGVLPDNRGPLPVSIALARPGLQQGVAVHQIKSRKLDAGPLLEVRTTAPRPQDSVIRLEHEVNLIGAEIVERVLGDPQAAIAQASAQERGAYFTFATKADLAQLRANGHRLCSISDLVSVSLARPNGQSAETVRPA